jgi:hypothetical protein
LGAFYEYALFLLVCLCVGREILRNSAPPGWQTEASYLLKGHMAWLHYVNEARQHGTLGPLRMENRAGRLCVVGLGQCRPVRNPDEGTRLIAELQGQIGGLFDLD